MARHELTRKGGLMGWQHAPVRRSRRWPLLVSVLVHLVVIGAWRIGVRLPESRRTVPSVFVLVPGDTADHGEVRMPRLPEEQIRESGEPVASGAARPRNDAGAPTRVARPVPPAGGAAQRDRRPPADTGAGGALAGGRIGPQYGDGQVWVEPYPETPSELADRVRRSHGQLVDSAVTAIVQGYLDSLAQEPGAAFAQMPEWVTNVGGRKYGLDAKYIYIAGLKIPSAVLALIPFPQGNVDQALANRRLADLRADLFQAARRADNAAEFKEAIREIRERKLEEEEYERNRRTPPSRELTP